MSVETPPALADAYDRHIFDCRRCQLCRHDGLVNPPYFLHPSPWADGMGSPSARVVVIGKDFAAADRMRAGGNWMRPDPKFRINENLPTLLRAAGLDERRDVYRTNAVLCLKPGGTSASLRTEWVKNCSSLLYRTIDMVKPEAVAALGEDAWRALGYAYRARLPKWSDAVGRGPVELLFGGRAGPALFAFGHPGARGTANRPLKQQRVDWEASGDWLGTERAAA